MARAPAFLALLLLVGCRAPTIAMMDPAPAPCPADAGCIDGEIPCRAPLWDAEGNYAGSTCVCTNMLLDFDNCGACGNSCASPRCGGGVCLGVLAPRNGAVP